MYSISLSPYWETQKRLTVIDFSLTVVLQVKNIANKVIPPCFKTKLSISYFSNSFPLFLKESTKLQPSPYKGGSKYDATKNGVYHHTILYKTET